ncbi:MAG: tryptophan--tRNA ligase [Verrucomicrobiota bacterium]|jgi:tryptophanyl-tRNA synthetase
MSEQEKKVVLTCAQPTGQLHLGNYFGAIRNWASLIDSHVCYFGIVDQHAITVPYVPAELRQSTYRSLALYIACGLDPAKCHLFCQSHVIGHTELAWILGCLCPLGQLERMTQFKDKSQREGSFIGAGLLNYPVLMAADILLYNADQVPVGEDQKQHVELCRDLAIKFNNTYSETFKVPDVNIPKTGARIKSLQDPEKKMSKSDANQSGCLYLLDPPATIRKKIRSAVTDSGSEIRFDPEKPGISNLLTILSATTGSPIEALEASFAGQQYGTFKEAVAEAVVDLLTPIQEKFKAIEGDKGYLDSVFKAGAEAAQQRANRILGKVYRKAGFVPRT